MKRFWKWVAPLAGAAVLAAGALVGSASATGEFGACYKADSGTVYPRNIDANNPDPCYIGPNMAARAVSDVQAFTVRGTHSDSNVLFRVVWYNSVFGFVGVSTWHQATGLSWGPGFNPAAGAVYYIYQINNYRLPAPGNDSFYTHI